MMNSGAPGESDSSGLMYTQLKKFINVIVSRIWPLFLSLCRIALDWMNSRGLLGKSVNVFSFSYGELLILPTFFFD